MWTLRFGILVPVLYFGTLLVSSLLYPGYSHVRQYASELGSATARYPYVFNAGIMVAGLATLVSLHGFLLVLRRVDSSKTLTWLFVGALGRSAPRWSWEQRSRCRTRGTADSAWALECMLHPLCSLLRCGAYRVCARFGFTFSRRLPREELFWQS